MEEQKEIGKQTWCLIIAIPFLVTLAQSLSTLSTQPCAKWSWQDFVIQSVVGTISGMLFGLIGGWLLTGDEFMLGAVSGLGAIVGIHGVQRIAVLLEKMLTKHLE